VPRPVGQKFGYAERMQLIAQAMQLREQGIPQREIAAELGVSQGTVSNWGRKYRNLPRAWARTTIAERIRAELVCCNIYERMAACDAAGDDEWMSLRHGSEYHDICFYGEWAARIAEETAEAGEGGGVRWPQVGTGCRWGR
jgi:hypothetical protein